LETLIEFYPDFKVKYATELIDFYKEIIDKKDDLLLTNNALESLPIFIKAYPNEIDF